MANSEHVAKLMEGAMAWNEWRELSRLKKSDDSPDLSEARLNGLNLEAFDLSRVDLTGANLSAAQLSWVKLNWANLCNANLRQATIIAANLSGAQLERADLTAAQLISSNLTWANLSDADLSSANLDKANLNAAVLDRSKLEKANLTWATFISTKLNETDFSGSRLVKTTFGGVDLSAARGLESIVHAGPSTVGIDTFALSKGNIPQAFMRGVGVSETFITYARSLLETATIEFHSCFISYSTKDQAFAERVHSDLQNKGVRCWFAPHDIAGGKKIHEQIDEAIRIYDRLLLILSDHSMKSEWVKTEIAKARKREAREKRRMLFPVSLVGFQPLKDWECFDADTGKDSAREIREYFIPDFSNWKDHDSYKAAFDRLIRDLAAKDSSAHA